MNCYASELKKRLVVFLVLSASLALSSFWHKEMILFLIVEPCVRFSPSGDSKFLYFIFTSAAGVFVAYSKLVFFVLAQLLLIFLSFQTLAFFSPGLFGHEFRLIRWFFALSGCSWVIASMFSNKLFVPLSWDCSFLLQSFISKKLMPVYFEANLHEFVDFYLTFHYATILCFQALTTSLAVTYLYGFDSEALKSTRKFYYAIFIILSTIMSPPDVLPQIFFASLLIMSFELGIFSFFFNRNF